MLRRPRRIAHYTLLLSSPIPLNIMLGKAVPKLSDLYQPSHVPWTLDCTRSGDKIYSTAVLSQTVLFATHTPQGRNTRAATATKKAAELKTQRVKAVMTLNYYDAN